MAEEHREESSLASLSAEELEQRLEEAVGKRETLQSKLKEVQSDFEQLLGKSPKRMRETVSELDKEIDALERKRTINSMPLAEEREILKQIARVQKKKREVELFENYDAQFKEKKAQVLELRETLKNLRNNITNLRAELDLSKMAETAGCSKDEIVCMKLECPQDKMGKVIGKKGSNVKQLSQKTHVAVDINRKQGDIRITGALDNLETAASDLDKVISSRQEEFEVPEILVDYLTARHITKLEEMRTNYPDLYVAMKRNTTMVTVRGIPEDLENFRFELFNLKIKKQVIDLPSAVSSYLVGKKGSNIEGLVLLHQTAIHIERKDEESQVTIVGPSSNVQAATEAIQEISDKMKEDSLSIAVDPIIKEVLLMENGKGIQAINKMVNAEKDSDTAGFVNVNCDGNNVVLKGRAVLLPSAFEIAKREVQVLESKVKTIDVDQVVIPKMIGKGGENIKKIVDGKPIAISFDRNTGRVALCGLVDEDLQAAEQRIRDIMANNQVERISLDSAKYATVIRDLIRTKSKEINAICHFQSDDETCSVVLRGSNDMLKQASAIVREYVEKNHFEELQMTNDELRALLQGGKNSKLASMQTEHSVAIKSDRERNVVRVRGEAENVMKAVDALNQYLFGGAGFAVEKLELEKEQIGVVIGREGKTKADLEKRYENVSIAVDGVENRITLRGPEGDTEACCVEIIKMVSIMQVTRTVETTAKQVEELKNDKAIFRGVPVTVTFQPELNSIKLRGFSDDVRHAVAILNEKLTGQYESRLKFATPQFRKIKDSCTDSNLLERIRLMTGASVGVESSDECIAFKGKQKQVKAAKQEVLKLLDFVLGSSFGHVNLDFTLIPVIGKVPVLADIASASGASLSLDRDLNVILISGKVEKVGVAMSQLRAKIDEAEKLSFVLQLEASEDWLISSIIGKKGSNIKSLRKEAKCSIDVDSSARRITVSGDNADLVKKAREMFNELIEKRRSEHIILPMLETDLPAFVGRGGSNVSEFQNKHGVEAQIVKGSGTIALKGDAEKVLAAKTDLLEWIQSRHDSRKDAEGEAIMQLKKSQIPAVVGPKGSTIGKLQGESGCRIDIDRVKTTLKISGGDAEKRSSLLKRIEEIIKEDADSRSEDNSDESAGKEEASKASARQKSHDDGKEKSSDKKEIVRKIPSPSHSYTAKDFPALQVQNADSTDENCDRNSGRSRSLSTETGSEWAAVVKAQPSKISVSKETAESPTATASESPPALDWCSSSSDESHHDDANSHDASDADINDNHGPAQGRALGYVN